MCGILAALGVSGDAEANRRDMLKLSKLLRHRGPDQNSLYQAPDGRAFIAFERLMIVDPTDSGRQAMGGRPRGLGPERDRRACGGGCGGGRAAARALSPLHPLLLVQAAL